MCRDKTLCVDNVCKMSSIMSMFCFVFFMCTFRGLSYFVCWTCWRG